MVAADPARGAFFIADEHLGSNASGGTTAIGLFRTTKTNLLSTVVCPSGTHSSAQAAACWPARTLVNPLPSPMTDFQQEFPSLAVDQRASGTGAGDVYVTGTEFDAKAEISRTWLVACKNNLSLCSAPVFISGTDSDTALSDVQVRPDGGITVTFISIPTGGAPPFNIKFTSCNPAGAPFTPGCSPPVLVQSESHPLELLFAEPLLAITFPKHTHRIDAGVTQTFVVWHRCRVSNSFLCPDSDVIMKYSTNGGATWLGPVNVDVSNDDQFIPSIATDSSTQTVNISYLNNHIDPVFQHLYILDLAQIPTGTTTPGAPNIVTSTADDPSSSPFFLGLGGSGFDSLGIAARGTGAAGASRIYGAYTYHLRPGTYNGIFGPQADNYLTRVTY